MRRLIFVLWMALAVNGTADAEVFDARVIAVSDGDTVKVLTIEKQQIKVRLAEIDAPEKDQPYGEKSKQALSKAVFGKFVAIKTYGKDRYGRTLGRVLIGSKDINSDMVATGNAWVYRKYSNDDQLLSLESTARVRKLGLWSLQADQITPPWEWRKVHREQR